MACNRLVLAAAVITALGLVQTASAQQDLKPLRGDDDNRKEQVSKLVADLAAAAPAKKPEPPPSGPTTGKPPTKAVAPKHSTPGTQTTPQH